MKYQVMSIQAKGEKVELRLIRNRFPFLEAVRILEIHECEKLAQLAHGAAVNARHAVFQRTGDEGQAFEVGESGAD